MSAPTRGMLIAAAAAGIYLGFPNDMLEIPPLVLLWPIGAAFLGYGGSSPKSAFLYGWLASFLGAAAALYWLCLPVRDVGQLPWPLAIMCALLIAACLALQGGVFAVCARYLRYLPLSAFAFALAAIWYLLEYAFAVALGFPWLPLAGALIIWPGLLQHADALGAYGGGALWLWAGLLTAFAPKSRHMWRPLLGAASIVLAILAYGWLRLPAEHLNSYAGYDVRAIFIEGNVDQNQKWLPQFQEETLDLYLRLTNEALARARKAGWREPLVIWPETALPFFFEREPRLAARIRDAARTYGVPLLFGAPGVSHRPGALREDVYNRAFLLGRDGQELGSYDKEHLVPFGEYLPDWLNFQFLKALTQGVGIYRAGSDAGPLVYDSLAMGLLICYEGIFPWLAQERVARGANILVDISNDGWFGHTPAARQHLYLTVLRCLEQNRWLLRATNTGISAVADTRGRVVMAGPQFQRGFLLARAGTASVPSPYSRLAPWLPFCALAAICGIILTTRKHKFRNLPCCI